MIKTIILLVIVFYTFPCRKINAQSRDTSNIFAGYYIAVYNKSDLSHKKIRRHHKHSYNTAIDSRYRTYFIPIKIGKNNINQENIWKEVTDNKTESDTIFIFPDSTDIKLFKQIGLIDSNISDKKHLLLQEIKSLPYYNTASNKAYLFKCLYVKGTFLQLRIDTIDKNWQDYLLDIYSISTKKKKKLLLVTGIDSLHSIKSDGTSIQARPYIKTGQQKPCTALIVGNWFAGEEGYIRKEALLEQGEPFVSWIRCNDCPQIRFNESNSGSVVYPGPPVSWNDPSNPDDPQAGYGYIPNDTTKEETFFYHSDHLGSTSYITDDKANITQYDAYLPYGELLVDEHSSSEDLPYKFNGKQFDDETGLYYYGARYMNPVTSLWYGVDPLAEKYVSTGGYVYTLDNPVKLSDIEGLYPKNVVIFHKTPFYLPDYYTLTAPVAHLLSLVSGVQEEYVKNLHVMEKGLGKELPWYPLSSKADEAGGAITLGDNPKYASTIMTRNYFEEDKSLGKNDFSNNTFEWLYLLSHEVRHLKHIEKAGSYFKYTGKFAKMYLKYFIKEGSFNAGHDKVPEEKEAISKSQVFMRFNNFVTKTLKYKGGLSALINNTEMTDSQKIKMIDVWWNQFNPKNILQLFKKGRRE